MRYFIDLFSPETHESFTKSDRSTSGFRLTQENIAKSIKIGDIFVCYITKISRFCGLLKVESEYFIDDSPIFYKSNDPFVVRFKVKPIIWLPFEKSIPIFNETVWNTLSFTGEGRAWTSMVRGSLREMKTSDGEFLSKMLSDQIAKSINYPLNEEEIKKLRSHKVKTQHSIEVDVSIPEDEKTEAEISKDTIRESIQIQALLAKIGERMNMKIWIPRTDRNRVLELWSPINQSSMLESLPLNYDDTTLKTIENIDVLWIKRRSIIRAFEVEHTTSIYSGILRMADLMALQPNMEIKAHIIAPENRKERVLQEISRPVFTLLEKGPLKESCTFISYDSIYEFSKEKRLEYMNDNVLDELAEEE